MNEYGVPRWRGEAGPPGTGGTGGGTTGTIEYEAGQVLESGQPVALSYEIMDGNEVRTTVVAVQVDTPTYLILGTTAYSANPGDMVTVVLNGVCDARVIFGDGPITYDPVRLLVDAESPTEVYDAGTNNGLFNFTDSGGQGGVYQPSANYHKIFDAGAGRTWNLEFQEADWAFEHTGFTIYDRMFVEAADNISSFTATTNSYPLSLSWMQSVGVSGHPFSQTSPNNQTYTARNVLPPSWSTALSKGATAVSVPDPNGVDDPHNSIFANTNLRFVRFTFISDSGVNQLGWNINLRSVDGTSTGVNPSYGSTAVEPTSGDALFVAVEDNTSVSSTPSAFQMGYAVSGPENGMVKMYRPIGG